MPSTDLPGNLKSRSECPTVEDVVVQYRFELFMMVHKLIIISFIPSLVSDRYSFAARARAMYTQINKTHMHSMHTHNNAYAFATHARTLRCATAHTCAKH